METTPETEVWNGRKVTALFAVLAVWFALAAYIGSSYLLANASGAFVAPIAMTAVVPVAVFLGSYFLIPAFRQFVHSQDIATLTMFQHWRVVGFAFLVLYAYGVLPGLFAGGGGLGDVAVGLAAPFIMLRLRSDASYATSKGLVRYHLLGLLDFVVAITTAGLTAGSFPQLIPGGVTSAPMDVWPLNLFPSFIVPAFIIMHLTVLLKVRHLRRTATMPLDAELTAA
ncbi:MAG: hypothetical protein GY948_15135 [Alphaproteobacteria bacterium]|nr:hypothetical protein [Alphaproteobacteria bacterium]